MSQVASPSLPPNDFPDWLSPILVKELRQGLKSRAFVSIATILQGGMAFLFVLAALSGMTPGSGILETLNGFFWFMLWVPLVFVTPSRALQAIAEETKLQTLELVQMTRMQSLRIVFGKWIALSAQSLLLVLAVLPYFVLRYFFGGVDLISDISNLGILIALSLLLTAAGLAGSTLKTGLRVVAVVATASVLIFVSQVVAFSSFYGPPSFIGGGSSVGLATQISCAAIILAAYVLFFLLQAAGHLSTQAESYSPKKRTLGLVCVLIIFVAWLLEAAAVIDLRIFGVLTPIVLWSVVEALVESRDATWLHDRHFSRWLAPFTPGWASGFFYSLGILLIIYVGLYFGAPLSKPEHLESLNKSYVIFIGAVLGPALFLTRLPRIRQRILFYWLIQLFFVLVYAGALMVALKPTVRDSDVLALLAPLPSSVALACLHESMEIAFIRSVFPTTAFVTAVILLAFAVLAFKSAKSLHHEAAATPN